MLSKWAACKGLLPTFLVFQLQQISVTENCWSTDCRNTFLKWSHVSHGPGMGERPPSYGASIKGKNVLWQQHGLKRVKYGVLCHLHAAGRPLLKPLQVQTRCIFAGPWGPLREKSTGRQRDCTSCLHSVSCATSAWEGNRHHPEIAVWLIMFLLDRVLLFPRQNMSPTS